MTQHLFREVEKLKKLILTLSALVEDRVYKAMLSVEQRDLDLAEEVENGDHEVDSMEVEVEEECLKLLALHQPVAIDLRFIIAVLKINSDLERIGDLAVNIAARAINLSKKKNISSPLDFDQMAEKVKSMLRKSLEALVNLDSAAARAVLASDDEVDDMHRHMYRLICENIARTPQDVDGMICFLSVSRNLERIADHATNIAEDVIYMIEGDIVRHGKIGQGNASDTTTN